MSCNCIPNGQFEVTKVGESASVEKLTGKYEAQMKELNGHMHIIDDNMCKWAQPEYTDMGAVLEKTFWETASIVLATVNANTQMDIARDQYDIAKRYTNLAKDRWNRFSGKYAPFERMMLNEANAVAEPKPNYGGARSRGKLYTEESYKFADDQINDLSKKFAICMDSSLYNDLDYSQQITNDDCTNYSYRDEENFALVMSDQRWNRRSNLLNLGRDNESNAAAYAKDASNALAQFGGLVESGAQGAMRLLGYMRTVRETQYPSLFSGAFPMTGQASTMMGEGISFGPYGNGSTG